MACFVAAGRMVAEETTDPVSIRLLGEFDVRVGDRSVEDLRSPRVRTLFAYLVLHPDSMHTRQAVAHSFWPDSTESQARTNLRNVVHHLRRVHPAIDGALDATATTLRWRPARPVDVDVDRFVTAADAALGTDPDDVERLLDRCRQAADLYAGDLMPEVHDDWVMPRRLQLQDRYRAVLRSLTTALIDSGRAAEALTVARDLVAADPMSESGHRLRIEAHRAAGDRAGAVRAYNDCVATLDRELGVEPDAVTVSLYASLLDSPLVRGSAVPLSTVPHRAELVGRHEEWRWWTACWNAALDGEPTVVLITGEAGVGKTRLAEEITARAEADGAVVGVARSYATEGDLGFAVVASWLRSPAIAASRRRLSAPTAGSLARVLPELGPAEGIGGADDAERRRRLFDAVVAALTAADRPVVLLADDAQWSDHASQEFIHYLVRQPLAVPVVVVLTVRREDLDIGHPLTALRNSLAVLDRVRELSLGRLGPGESAELGAQLVGEPLDHEAASILFAESEGNPLFIVETIRAGWEPGTGPATMTPRLRAVIDERLRRLSEVATRVVGAAAVVGRPCSAGLIGAVTDYDDATLAEGLDELWQRGIVCETGSDLYGFTHGKLRDVAYEGLTPAVRRRHHGTVADVLAEIVRYDSDLSSNEVAAHFQAANRPVEATAWLQRAALDAERVFAYADAVRLIDRALDLVPSLPSDIRHVRELELLSTLPVALGGTDGYGTRRMSEAHRRASDVAQTLGVDLDPAFIRSMVMAELCRDEFTSASQSASRLLDHASATGDASLYIESRYLLGIAAFWGADLHLARQHFEAVVDEFDSSSRQKHHDRFGHDPQVVCLSRLANTLWFLGRSSEARAACDEALAMGTSVGSVLSHDIALVFAAMLAIDLGDRDLLRRAATTMVDNGFDALPFELKGQAFIGLLEVFDGQPEGGVARIRGALARCDGRNFFPAFQATLGRVLAAAADAGAAADPGFRLEACTEVLAMGSTRLWVPEIRRVRAELLHRTNANQAEVGAELDRAAAVARRHGMVAPLTRIDDTRQRLGVTPAGERPFEPLA